MARHSVPRRSNRTNQPWDRRDAVADSEAGPAKNARSDMLPAERTSAAPSQNSTGFMARLFAGVTPTPHQGVLAPSGREREYSYAGRSATGTRVLAHMPLGRPPAPGTQADRTRIEADWRAEVRGFWGSHAASAAPRKVQAIGEAMPPGGAVLAQGKSIELLGRLWHHARVAARQPCGHPISLARFGDQPYEVGFRDDTD